MKRSTAWTIIVIIIVIIVGILIWHYNMSGSSAAAGASQQSTASAAPTDTSGGTGTLGAVPDVTSSTTATGTQDVIVLNTTTNTTLGTFLVAANGMTLYTYGKDSPGISNCNGSCAAAWPPYTVTMPAYLKGGAGVSGTISTITRADGTTQVTYKDAPLYFFASDAQPGDAAGQNVGGFSVAKP